VLKFTPETTLNETFKGLFAMVELWHGLGSPEDGVEAGAALGEGIQ